MSELLLLASALAAELRSQRIHAERQANRDRKQARTALYLGAARAAPDQDDEPPPF